MMSADELEKLEGRDRAEQIIVTLQAIKTTLEIFADELKNVPQLERQERVYECIAKALQYPPSLDGLTHKLTKDELDRLFTPSH